MVVLVMARSLVRGDAGRRPGAMGAASWRGPGVVGRWEEDALGVRRGARDHVVRVGPGSRDHRERRIRWTPWSDDSPARAEIRDGTGSGRRVRPWRVRLAR